VCATMTRATWATLFLGLSCLACSTAMATEPSLLEFGIENQGKTVDVHVGEKFAIRLHENPTTGYRWQVKDGLNALPSEVHLVDSSYQKPATNPGERPKIGAGGIRQFVFEVRHGGDGFVVLEYARPWEHGGVNAQFQLGLRCT